MENAIAVRNAATAISQLSNARRDFEDIITQAISPDDRDLAVQRSLLIIAEIRQASVSAETLRLYGRALRAYDVADLQGAIMYYKRTPREQGETAMPDMPSLEIIVRKCRSERLGLAEQQRREDEEREYRKRAEADRGKPISDDPEVAATLDRLNKQISLKRSLVDGETQRRRETASRAREVLAPSCCRCALMDDLTPAELRMLADQREAKHVRAAIQEGQAA